MIDNNYREISLKELLKKTTDVKSVIYRNDFVDNKKINSVNSIVTFDEIVVFTSFPATIGLLGNNGKSIMQISSLLKVYLIYDDIDKKYNTDNKIKIAVVSGEKDNPEYQTVSYLTLVYDNE